MYFTNMCEPDRNYHNGIFVNNDIRVASHDGVTYTVNGDTFDTRTFKPGFECVHGISVPVSVLGTNKVQVTCVGNPDSLPTAGAGNGISDGGTIVSGVVSIVIMSGDGTKIDIKNLKDPVSFVIPITSPNITADLDSSSDCEKSELICQWREEDATDASWAEGGCETTRTAVDLPDGGIGAECTCNHLTGSRQ
jgi:hypothetical protein